MSVSSADCPTDGNNLLSELFANGYEHLKPHFEFVTLKAGQVLHDCGETIRHIYFPIDAVLCLLSTMANGATAGVGIIGTEGLSGASVLLGVDTTPHQSVVLLTNQACRVKAETLKSEFDRGGKLQALMLRYLQAFFTQVTQTAACNRVHQTEARLCRWLLTIHDRIDSDDLPVTQETMAQMLGTPRPYVTVALHALEKSGSLRCRRGHIVINNRQILENSACECYTIVREQFAHILGAEQAKTNAAYAH